MSNVETVIFLGAGASKADGAPLQNELMKTYFSDVQVKGSREYKRLARFFYRMYGIDVTNPQVTYPSFEEVLGIIEISLESNTALRGYTGTRNRVTLETLKNDLIGSIADVLDSKLTKTPVHCERLISRLLQENTLRETAFISLNYDIIIDNCILRAYDKNVDLEYGLEFRNFTKLGDWKRARPEQAVRLHKLHGSLNWLFCPCCEDISLTPKEKLATSAFKQGVVCKICEGYYKAIVIPPTFIKPMDDCYIRQVWRNVRDDLLSAKRIVFCGYSFPDADINIKHLLKSVEMMRKKPLKVYVVNEHTEKKNSVRSIEKLRYESFFKGDVRFLKMKFEDFAQEGINWFPRIPMIQRKLKLTS